MRRATVVIEGVTPFLMHAYKGDEPNDLMNRTPREQAEFHTYRSPVSQEYAIPSTYLAARLINGAIYSKGKGRSSLQRIVAASLSVEEVEFKLGAKDFDVYSIPVVIPATRGRIMRHRARFNSWGFSFTVKWEEDLLKLEQVRTVVNDSGALVGLGDYRPAKRGPFGQFKVVSFVEL